jgi:hypothetical protein
VKSQPTRAYGLLRVLGGLIYLGTCVAAAAFPDSFGNSAEPVTWFSILLAGPVALGLYFLTVFMPWLIAAHEPNFLVPGCAGRAVGVAGALAGADAHAPTRPAMCPKPGWAGHPGHEPLAGRDSQHRSGLRSEKSSARRELKEVRT